MKNRPDDRIFAVKDFINELEKVQQRYFDKLCLKVGIPHEGTLNEYFFDYIFNENDLISFGEYLDKLNQGDLWDGA